MSVWSWKRSSWVNSALAASLILAVMTGICSSGIRREFQVIPSSFSFYGGFNPEIGLFNLLLYFSVLFGFISVALRYSFIIDQNQVMPAAIEHLNKISGIVGIFSFFGLVIIASFPSSIAEKNDTFQSTGAYIFIGLGLVFTILQTVLTYTSFRFSAPFIIRLCFAIALMSTFISSIVLLEKNKEISLPSNITVSQNYSAFSGSIKIHHERLIACGLEWASVAIYAFYFLSFFLEFQQISSYIILRPFIVPASDFRSSSLTINERV